MSDRGIPSVVVVVGKVDSHGTSRLRPFDFHPPSNKSPSLMETGVSGNGVGPSYFEADESSDKVSEAMD